MILSGPEIRRLVEMNQCVAGTSFLPAMPVLDVTPWRPEYVGPNSLDVHLGPTLLAYAVDPAACIDPLNPPPTYPVPLDVPGGWLLHPGRLYLGATQERVELHGLVAWVDGRSSMGRLGVQCHMTAGLIDDGFSGAITLEITVVHPTILRPGMRLAQLTFARVEGERQPYRGRYQSAAGPEASKYHRDGGGA